MKVCSKCKIEKELSEFGKRSGSKDGHKGACKECVNIKSRKTYLFISALKI